MTLSEITAKVSALTRVSGGDFENIAKTIINDCIEDFVRLWAWTHLEYKEDFTVTYTEAFDLSTLTEPFKGEIEVFSSGAKVYKCSYPRYIGGKGDYAITGNIFYATAGDYTIIYRTTGTPEELSSDDDENFVTKFYGHIIVSMAIYKFLAWLGDFDAAGPAKEQMAIDINTEQRKENRERNVGQRKTFVRHREHNSY